MNEIFSARVNLCDIWQSNVFQTDILISNRYGLNSIPSKAKQAKANLELTS